MFSPISKKIIPESCWDCICECVWFGPKLKSGSSELRCFTNWSPAVMCSWDHVDSAENQQVLWISSPVTDSRGCWALTEVWAPLRDVLNNPVCLHFVSWWSCVAFIQWCAVTRAEFGGGGGASCLNSNQDLRVRWSWNHVFTWFYFKLVPPWILRLQSVYRRPSCLYLFVFVLSLKHLLSVNVLDNNQIWLHGKLNSSMSDLFRDDSKAADLNLLMWNKTQTFKPFSKWTRALTWSWWRGRLAAGRVVLWDEFGRFLSPLTNCSSETLRFTWSSEQRLQAPEETTESLRRGEAGFFSLRFPFCPSWHRNGLVGRKRESGGKLMMKKSTLSLRLH